METSSNDNSTALPAPTETSTARFLASPYVKGIGPAYAARIVETLGVEAPDVIMADVSKATEVPGLGEAKAEPLAESLRRLKQPWRLIAFLYSCGLNDADVEKILSHYGKLSTQVVLYDPYEMVEDAWKFSFFSADKIGRALGIERDDMRRLKGAVLTAVKIYAENGNIYATVPQAIELASRITGADASFFTQAIDSLVDEERLVRSHDALYLPVYYRAEREGAEKIAAIIRSRQGNTEEQLLALQTDIDGRPLSAQQVHAIETVLNNPVTVITGGPGTGKTTTVKGIVEILEAQGKKVVLAAPTGRAAKRMNNLTGMEATTLHRLLGYRMGEGYRNKKLDADILVIDEASMLEQVMLNHLLQAIGNGTKIVMVGDTDQLPSIGAGDVLNHFIASGIIPVVRLSENFRQKEGSGIAESAIAINKGRYPRKGRWGTDFNIIYASTSKAIKENILELVGEKIPARYGIDPRDIQVVTPQIDGPLGSKQLNIDIRERVNPSGPQITKGAKTLRLNDRVMQTVNSSTRGVYNGETGWVSAVDEPAQTFEVTFHDGKRINYSRADMGELTLSYATTVHKLQGSETDYMVMVVATGHWRMLYRNLLYTAVSRARRLCVLVGEKEAIERAVDNTAVATRNSRFMHRLREYVGPSNHPPQLTA